ncbi:MAG: hypothetical protein HYU36_04720 [Planctomycetes bacterium]|nr:hypothetical protein [Planctomycetota bacterium]
MSWLGCDGLARRSPHGHPFRGGAVAVRPPLECAGSLPVCIGRCWNGRERHLRDARVLLFLFGCFSAVFFALCPRPACGGTIGPAWAAPALGEEAAAVSRPLATKSGNTWICFLVAGAAAVVVFLIGRGERRPGRDDSEHPTPESPHEPKSDA